MFAKALANDEDNLGGAIGTTVYFDAIGSRDELGNLMGSQLVGIDAECQSVDRHIEVGVVFFGQGMLHFSNGAASHQLMGGNLVVPRGDGTPDEKDDAGDASYRRQPLRQEHEMIDKPLVQWLAERREQYRNFPGEMSEAVGGGQYLYDDEQQYPSHATKDDRRGEACCDEVARLASIGFPHQHEHGRVERRAKVDKAIDVGDGSGVQGEVEYPSYPEAYFLRDESQDGAGDV